MDNDRTVRFQGDGLSLNAIDYGGRGKPPLLFLHGGSAHAHWWDFIGPDFARDFHALAPDLRGHGDSDWPSEWAYGSRHYVSDLGRIIDQLSPGPPILVGHSMGAHNTLLYASAHSRKLKAIVIIDTLPEYPQVAVDFLRAFAEKKPRGYDTLDEAVARFRLLPPETLAPKEVLDHVARHTFIRDDGRRGAAGRWVHKLDRRTFIREPLSVWDGLDGIQCPALVIKIPMSPIMKPEDARKMMSLLPRGVYAEIEPSYHHAMFDNPERLKAELRKFLSKVA